MIKQLAHLCFMSNRLPEMLAFYRDVLGLPVKFALKHDDGTPFGYYLSTGQTTFIEIFDQHGAAKQWGGEPTLMRPNAGTCYNHFCFEVTGLEEFCATLRARGVEVTSIKVGMDHSKQAWLKDPDGNAIELMEYTAASWQL
jgi:lactoylglutathione lyase